MLLPRVNIAWTSLQLEQTFSGTLQLLMLIRYKLAFHVGCLSTTVGSEYRTRGQTPNGPVLECYLNPEQPDHFNTRQMNSSKGLGFFTSEAPPLSQHIMRAGQLGALVKYTSRLEANKNVSHQ